MTAALNVLRAFCLDEVKTTFFRVDFRDKEDHQAEYALLQSLLDLRIVHLIAPSLADRHEAGRRFEVFMLDLSQFSGQRLKKHLHVLDLQGGRIVLKKTGSKEPQKVGNSFIKLQALLRLGPQFKLDTLTVLLRGDRES